MAQRVSGYKRVEHDRYQTPQWVAEALCEHFDIRDRCIWEPAAGDGYLAEALRYCGASDVVRSDLTPPQDGITEEGDFLSWHSTPPHAYAVVTNPPFGPRGCLAVDFITQSVALINLGFIQAAALLLPVDFDSASGRLDLFRDNPLFAAKIVLNRRIAWVGMEPEPGKPGPSSNHCWMVWQRQALYTTSRPVTLYAGAKDKEIKSVITN